MRRAAFYGLLACLALAIAAVRADLRLYDDLTARENLAFWGQMYDLGGKALKARVAEVLEALGEVEDALVRERKQQELIVSLEKQLELSGQVIGRLRDSYLNGAVDYLRVLDVVLRHQALQRELLFARRELIGHRIDLCRALGTGWEMHRPELATP